MFGSRFVVLAVVASVITACGAPTPAVQSRATVAPAVVTNQVVAAPVTPDPRIGAIFAAGSSVHSCSGAVLDSLAGNLVITAAHCLDSSTESWFAPGYSGAVGPVGFWRIDAVYLDPRWVRGQDPSADVAIARVSRVDPATEGTLEQRVGSGFILGSAPAAGVEVAVTGYPTGDGGVPIGCRSVTIHPDRGFPAVLCHGLVDGTSGAPWVSGSTVRGVIGGLQGGGCNYSDVSYSSPFDVQTRLLYQRAQEGGAADQATGAPDDGCASIP